ncbi:hypothetical protein MMC19_000928, partial [Ptychographa xylographoides]|nr:hypothetical protein [Ptychographa xylographoides]
MGHEDHAFRTWTHVSKTGKTLWPREFLPQDFPKARIWIFGYNSNVSKGVSEATISDHANSLLDVLQCERHAGRALLNAKGNPYFNPIWEAAVGLVFFGTPHRGGNAGGAAALAARIAKLWANDSAENNLLMCLKPDSLFTQESSERFSEQLDKYHILTFIETIPMEFHGF